MFSKRTLYKQSPFLSGVLVVARVAKLSDLIQLGEYGDRNCDRAYIKYAKFGQHTKLRFFDSIFGVSFELRKARVKMISKLIKSGVNLSKSRIDLIEPGIDPRKTILKLFLVESEIAFGHQITFQCIEDHLNLRFSLRSLKSSCL